MGSQYKHTDSLPQAFQISMLISQLGRDGTMVSMETIGSRVKLLRTSRRMTQTALAMAVGIKQSAISQIETGETATVSGEVLAALCRELTTTPEFLLAGAGSAEDFESAMQIAEVASLMRLLPSQAREALLNEARLVARATLPKGSSSDPFRQGAPKSQGDRRQYDEPVPVDRRKH